MNIHDGNQDGAVHDDRPLLAVLYARVSGEEMPYSIQMQLDACQAYAVQEGYTVLAHFTDEYTGARMDRPGLDQLRQYIELNKVDAVVVYDLDRLARKRIYQLLIEEELKQKGIKVLYVAVHFDDSEESELQKEIRAQSAEYEKAKFLERGKRGKQGKARSGFVIVGARPPYGYRVIKEGKKSWLEVIETEAHIIILVFTWYVYGDETGTLLSIRAIAKRLTSMQIPTRGDQYKHVRKKRGYGIWQAAMIKHILTNEAYIGTWYFGKSHMVSDGKESTRQVKPKVGLGKQVRLPREEWIPVAVPAIIDLDLWNAAQVRLEQVKKDTPGRNVSYPFLLSRRFRCGKCGYGILGRKQNGRFVYFCNGRRQVPSVCDQVPFSGRWLDNDVWNWVKSLVQNRDEFLARMRARHAEDEQLSHHLRERLCLVDTHLAETQRHLERLLDLYLRGEFPKEMLVERKARLELTQKDLQQEREELLARINTVTVTEDQIIQFERLCTTIRLGNELSVEEQQEHLNLLDLQGTLVVENNQKVAYVKCLLGEQRLVYR